MGTRSHTGFKIDGKEILTYAQYDGYPDVVGLQVFNFVRSIDDVEAMREKVRALRVIDMDTKPTDEDYEKYAQYWDKGVSEGDDWYALLRELQADLAGYVEAGVLLEGGDILGTEYKYVVDLDDEVLRSYAIYTDQEVVFSFEEVKNLSDERFVEAFEEEDD